jgi:hypothetical protein
MAENEKKGRGLKRCLFILFCSLGMNLSLQHSKGEMIHSGSMGPNLEKNAKASWDQNDEVDRL